MTDGNVNEAATSRTAQAQPGSGAASGYVSRLYKVTVEKMVVVQAKTRHEAQMLGERHVNDDDSEPTGIRAVEVKSLDDLPPEWRDAIPYGGDRKDYRECRELVTQNSELRRADL